ncbi:MAG: hypothetical protein ACE3JK_01655 [Sporolactobacillus sp.]
MDVLRPFLMGICSREEALTATAHELAVYNRMAELKKQLLGGES